MGKYAGYPYPEISPNEAEEIAKTINKEIGDTIEQSDREELAKELGHQSADSGTFRQKLTALKRYGLLKGRGTLHTTELADRLVSGDESAYRDMMNQVHILKEAYEYFDGRRPRTTSEYSSAEDKTWSKFFREVLGGSGDGPEKLKDYYDEFRELVPRQHQEEKEEYLNKEREFDYYLEKLDNPNTRQAAIRALKQNLGSKRIPDKEPLEDLLQILEEDKYPDNRYEIYNLLHVICSSNDLDRFEENKRDEVINFLYEKLEEYRTEELIDDREKERGQILDTLEVLQPDDLVDRLWTLLVDTLEQGAETSNREMIHVARREFGNRLMKGREDITTEFYRSKADEAEDELWELMASNDDDNLRKTCQRLLDTMGVLY